MTYRKRREARAARLREWAAKREQKAEAGWEKADEMRERIPPGQPILEGHHSQQRDERHRARIDTTDQRAMENHDKAKDMTRRADTIDEQLAAFIYDDDPDAIPHLQERIAELEAERDRIKRYNATCREGEPDLTLLKDNEHRWLLSVAADATARRRGGALPPYHLAGITNNLSRQRKRLAALIALRDAQQGQAPNSDA